MFRSRLGLALAVLLCVTPPLSAQTWERGLEIPTPDGPATAPRLVALSLTSELLQETPDSSPLSVVDHTGRSIPSLVHERTGTTRRRSETVTPITSIDLTARPDGSLSVTIQLPDKSPAATAFRFETPLRDFERSVSVWAIENGVEQPVASNQFLFDLSRFMDTRRIDVPIKTSAARQFRIEIAAPNPEQSAQLREWTLTTAQSEVVGKTERFTPVDQPFRINRILALSASEETVAGARLEREIPIKWELDPLLSPGRTTSAFRIETGNVPIHRLALESSSANFSRPVTLYRWSARRQLADAITSGRIHRFRYGSIDESHLEISLGSPVSVRGGPDRLSLEIENGDSPALAIDRIRAYGPDLQLVFLAEPGETYRVRYGQQPRQSHDTAALTRLLDSGQPALPAALAGAAVVIDTPQPVHPGFWNRPAFLIPTISLLVAGFAFSLYRAVLRIDTLPPGDPPTPDQPANP